jgi:hypothetical protein
MPRPRPEFDGTEGDVLIAIYERPDLTFSSDTLTQRLNPSLQITAPEYHVAFADVNSVIEKHFVRKFVLRKRSRNAAGVLCFNNVKLTIKGEQAAIQERERRALPEQVQHLLDIAKKIRDRDKE